MVKTLDFETLTDEECELLKSLWSKENDYIKNKEMESKKNFNGELIQAIYDKKTTESEYLKLLKMISIKDSVFSTEKTVTDKTEFMLEDKQILTDASPYHLREDVEVIIASIMGRNKEEWAYLAKELTKAGADLLELNF